MNYKLIAQSALDERKRTVDVLRALDSDRSVPEHEKRERIASLEADVERLTEEARSAIERGERESEVRDLSEKSGLYVVNRGGSEHRYGAGKWLAGELRALTGASGPGAAFTPGENAKYFFDRLTPNSVLLASGVNVITTDRDSLNVPRVLTDPAADFIAEAGTLPGGDATADVVTATPRKIAHLTQMSNEIIDDSDPALLDVYGRQIFRAIGLRYDLGAFEGTGTAPQIRGLKNVSGITNSNLGANGATPASLDFIADALGAIETANGRPGAIVCHPRTWQALSKIKSVTGGTLPVLMESAGSASQGLVRSIYGVPVYLSSQLSVTETQGSSSVASSVYVYDPAALYAVMRSAIRVERDTSRLFNSDQSEVRGIMRGDMVVSQPSAVVRIAGVLA